LLSFWCCHVHCLFSRFLSLTFALSFSLFLSLFLSLAFSLSFSNFHLSLPCSGRGWDGIVHGMESVCRESITKGRNHQSLLSLLSSIHSLSIFTYPSMERLCLICCSGISPTISLPSSSLIENEEIRRFWIYSERRRQQKIKDILLGRGSKKSEDGEKENALFIVGLIGLSVKTLSKNNVLSLWCAVLLILH
jgi:hypothetical protein